ncbi:hypothetical protein OG978_42440 (plasmid) [Streptomyces sp. NBC_01591]|uniref:hypothetical protein n=1 Tax=Streptomyces sp. NBC_01591 TaxID=2975888 RepID=UPI002DDC0D62|nr:hypothetical protein [Streptomyces sp. NBC_01591]WSD73848.1 hypothetical protein OG978_42440 [Streptomyces sp. NBC_01591]
MYDDILNLLGEQLGTTTQETTPSRTGKRKLKGVTFEYESDPRSVHSFAGGAGYSLASNWFTQLLPQLFIANGITKSQLCVFLYVAGGQRPGTGIAEYTQQEITDGLNGLAAKKPGAKKITRPTVNRAVRTLCEYKWLESAGNGRIRLNVTLWFQGNSAAQHEVLAQIAADHDNDPTAFPHSIGPEMVHHQEALDLNLDGEVPEPVRRKRTG